MPYNGSGTWAAAASSFNPAVAGTQIDVNDWATLLADFSTGLSTAICKDGQTTTTARIPFAAGVSVSDGSLGAPGINFTSDTDNGLYRIGANNWGFSGGGVKVAEVFAAGFVIALGGNQTFANDATLNFPSGTDLHVGHSGVASQIRSTSDTSILVFGPGADEIYFPNHTTTATAANAVILSGNSGQLVRSTSSLLAKTEVEDIAAPEKVLDLRGIWFRSILPADDPTQSFYSFGAEEVAAVDPRFAIWGRDVIGHEEPDETGTRKPILSELRPNGINHVAILAHVVETVKALTARTEALEAK